MIGLHHENTEMPRKHGEGQRDSFRVLVEFRVSAVYSKFRISLSER